MSITASAIRRSRVTYALVGCLILAGVMAYQGMARQMDPDFVVRAAQIVALFPGASPERVEELVTDPIEKVVQEIPELDFVSSESRTGLSVVVVNVREEYKAMRPIWDNLRRKVDRIKPDLPDGVVSLSVDDEFGDVYSIILSVSADGFSYRELKDIADEVRDELLHVDDVAKVEIIGEQEERIFVEYNNARLAGLGLSPWALRDLLKSRNIIMSGGDLTVGREEMVLEPSGNFSTIEEVQRTVIQIPGSEQVTYLGDIATIRRAYVDPAKSSVQASGIPALALAISMRTGGNLIALGDKVRGLYEALPRNYPHGIDFGITFFEPTTVDNKVKEFTSNVMQAVLIVLLVMLLTLGLRTGAAVATLIPSTMVIALLVMNMAGISLNQLSLAALIIALGLLVDNAIVMSESIMVLMGEGKKAFDAAVQAAKELRVPLLIASLTTSAAFLPIFLAKSTVGEYTRDLFTVVTITLLISWVLAITLTPLMCVTFIRIKQQQDTSFDSRFYRGYRAVLLGFLRYRWVSLGAVVVVFLGSMQLFKLVPQIFFPPAERQFFMADFTLPQGSPIEQTKSMVSDINAFIDDELRPSEAEQAAGMQGVSSWTSFVGASPPRFVLSYNPKVSETYNAVFMLNTVQAEGLGELISKLERFAVDHFPDVKTHVRRLGAGPPVDKPIQVRVSGKDTDKLFRLVDQVSNRLATIEGTRNIADNWGSRVKKLVVQVNAERARRAGVSNMDVAVSLQTFLSGIAVTEFREDEDTIPVVLRSVASDRQDIDRLETLNVFSQATGESVPLRQVASLDLEFQPSKILRRDRYRTVTIEAEVEPGVTAIDVINQLDPWLQEQSKAWGLGYRYEYGGEIESSVKANQSIVDQLPIAGLIIVLLLVWQFNSFRRPVIVLTTIPLALMGVAVGLVVMRSYFGFMTFLGIISLAGIVINNAIVLIDRIELEINANGLAPQAAIIEAAQRRLRPILLTTATTVASLIPLYLGGGIMFEPMAVAIMFGLIFSTALTLGFVPLAYSLLFRVSYKGYEYEPPASKTEISRRSTAPVRTEAPPRTSTSA